MRCPKCANPEDKVIDSRAARNGDAIRRRRVCAACGHRFTTYEEVVKTTMRILKRDGRYEEFDRKKLVGGVLRACEKRPISNEQIDMMVDGIISELEAEYEQSEIPSRAIGAKIMNRLEKIDEVAYVRFASVYRRFKAATDFVTAVEGIIHRQ